MRTEILNKEGQRNKNLLADEFVSLVHPNDDSLWSIVIPGTSLGPNKEKVTESPSGSVAVTLNDVVSFKRAWKHPPTMAPPSGTEIFGGVFPVDIKESLWINFFLLTK